MMVQTNSHHGLQGLKAGELRRILDDMLGVSLPAPIMGIACRPSAMWTSARLEEIDVALADGSVVALLIKDVGREGLHESARAVKRADLHDAAREINVYRHLLAHVSIGTPRFYGSLVDAARGRHWLVVERVSGVELFQVGDLTTWVRVAAWLADAQRRLWGRLEDLPATPAWLVRYDATFYRQWLAPAIASARKRASANAAVARLEWLAARHDALLDRLDCLPRALIHGELYASNVLVTRPNDASTGAAAHGGTSRVRGTRAAPDNVGCRISAVDWETAGVGPALFDLAALATGWSGDAQRAMTEAYWAALGADAARYGSLESLMEGLACCQLQRAIQWLGWFGDHSPPPEHAYDWLGQAVSSAEGLAL